MLAEPGKTSLRVKEFIITLISETTYRWENMSHSDKHKSEAQSACFRHYYYITHTQKNVPLGHMAKSTFS